MMTNTMIPALVYNSRFSNQGVDTDRRGLCTVECTKRLIFTLVVGVTSSLIIPAASQAGPVISTQTAAQAVVSDTSVSTETTGYPKLLWEKKLTKKLTSFEISKDGTKIAIADETGYLTLYNAKGEKLWDYHYAGELPKQTLEFKPEKTDTVLMAVAFSRSGKYIVCDLGVVNTYERGEGADHFHKYEPYKKLCFDSEGKLLWQTFKRGEHIIGGDEYVLIRPLADEEEVAPITHYLLDIKKGQVLFTGKTSGRCMNCRGFSEDNKYVFVDDKLMESKSGRTVWKFAERFWGFSKISKNFAIVSRVGTKKDRIYDIATRKQLFLDMYQAVSLTSNYVAGRKWDKEGLILIVYEIKTGRKVWTRRYKDGSMFYLTKGEKYLFMGGEHIMLLYDMQGKEMWKLPVIINSKVKMCFSYRWRDKFKHYSVTENGKLILFGHNRTVKLYRAF